MLEQVRSLSLTTWLKIDLWSKSKSDWCSLLKWASALKRNLPCRHIHITCISSLPSGLSPSLSSLFIWLSTLITSKVHWDLLTYLISPFGDEAIRLSKCNRVRDYGGLLEDQLVWVQCTYSHMGACLEILGNIEEIKSNSWKVMRHIIWTTELKVWTSRWCNLRVAITYIHWTTDIFFPTFFHFNSFLPQNKTKANSLYIFFSNMS